MTHTLRVIAVVSACCVVTTSASAQKSIQEHAKIRASAEQAVREQRWPDAAAAWERVITNNPFDARAWYGVGLARQNAADRPGAIRAYSRYLQLGGSAPRERTAFGPDSPAELALLIARLHAEERQPAESLDWMKRALALGLRNAARLVNDTLLIAAHGRSTVRALIGVEERGSAERNRRADIAFLRQNIARLHAGKRLPETLDAELDQIVEKAAVLSDNQFAVALQRALVQAGDAHTTFVPEQVAAWQHTLPLQFESFADSLFIMAADSAYADLVGARIMKIGDVDVAVAMRALDAISSRDNEYTVLRNRARNLRYPQILNGLGLSAEDDAAIFRIQGGNGAIRTVRVKAKRVENYHRFAAHPSWVRLDRSPPVSRIDQRSPYWLRYLPKSRTLYVAFNSVINTPTQSLAAFAASLLSAVDTTAAERLVIDLRSNNGGDSRLLLPFTDGIARSRLNRPGQLYVIVGRYTYSAGMNTAVFLERHTDAIFVGEPTPSSPNFVGESNLFNLPHTNIPISISDIFWQSSWPFDARTSIAPQHYYPPIRIDYLNGHDSALEAILALALPHT